MRILFVCIGNICRSPIAEGVLKDIVDKKQKNWKIASAAVRDYHIGKAPHPSSQKVCAAHGIDISTQKAMLFKVEHLDQYDKIYAMATDVIEEIKDIAGEKYDSKKISLFLDYKYPGENKSVTDPYYGDESGYLPVFSQIKENCAIIYEKYENK
ncbi:MAG TPA: low molecular weight protein-tyrosine-phosphatase [Chitinophagaceae bacterium]|nr:low molecular weight protein-tyrosine-phosphatase [Chitinophagaceae bacterium]